MKLRTTVLILLSAAWVVFAILAFTQFIQSSSTNFLSLVFLFALITLAIVTFFVFRRIDQLNQNVKEINLAVDHKQHLDLKGNDELTTLAIQINSLINQIQSLHKIKLQSYEDSANDLKNKNIELQQELNNLANETKSIERAETLTRLAHYDNLTSLPNRIFFNEILNKAINHAKRRKKIFALLVIDIDAFKQINARLGPAAGDQVLKELGNRFSTTLRSEDILARLSGDEFMVLLNDIAKPKFASAVAEKLLQACAKPLKIYGRELSLKASIGICIYPSDGTSLEDLLKNADSALDKVKRNGGNAYQFYTQEMNIEAHEFIQLETALRKAIQNKELVLYYQPRLDIKKGNINGVEALIRWVHPELGTIDPAKLIMLAEETGLIMQIGEWALFEACKMNKYWQDEGYEHMSVAVNISPRQFHHPDLSKIILNALKTTHLNPKYLELEINESAIMDDIDSSISILANIKATGVLISIDHFGIGYTSISHLKKLPISILKIDRSFIKGLPHNPNDLAITNALIALAHNLGLEVIAEGVETAEQVQYLSGQNCDMIQGYFLSHPLAAQKIVAQFTKLGEEVLL